MNNRADDKGQQLQLMAIQHPSGKVSMERFFNISLVNLDQLCKDLQASEHVKDYIQHFAHPVICHNQGLNSLVPHQVVQTLRHQGLDSNRIATVTAHIKENRTVICELVQEVTILRQFSGSTPLDGSQPTCFIYFFLLKHNDKQEYPETSNHLSKLQEEVNKVSIDLNFIYREFGKFKHKIDEFQAEKATFLLLLNQLESSSLLGKTTVQ
ncbi:hypothetical protein DSO57_1024234 [Entomophthora muscae]|uniref:Uncharacterized protein n=1 Tax=Entomophthora muscae TaxID=34485 RepID=A0ACC2TE24_9FUNG|nr:hypothetical protein DSO57_1024234 [Entomophthora muscae]